VSRKKTKSLGASGSDGDLFPRALAALKRGEVIVFPTETFYGLGADATNAAAVEQVVSLKGRSLESPIAVIVAGSEMLEQIATEVSPLALKLIERFWPGPLTLILPAKKDLPAPLINRDGGIGVRVSGHPLATRLARELGRPITATSANPTGKGPARSVAEALGYFSGRVEIFLDGGRLRGKIGSTVAEIVHGRLKIVREGAIPSEELQRILAT
jgi:L-threonylcarbamoyladenylate synthase